MDYEELLNNYPAISDLKIRAKRKMPHFAWEYLDSGTGYENLVQHNQTAFDAIRLLPRVAKGVISSEISATVLGKHYDMPIGISPVGMSGIFWPKAELFLAQAAKNHNIPYCLSTVACERLEDVAAIAGDNCWFQLYPLKDWDVNLDIMERCKKSGIDTLVVTVDVPTPSMRERQRRAGLKMPPSITLTSLLQSITRPHWALSTLANGTPHFKNLTEYAGSSGLKELADYLKQNKSIELDWAMIKKIRKAWSGKLVIKGILHPDDGLAAMNAGADAIILSNHGGRQFDGGPSSITMLPKVLDKVGKKIPVMLDSGINSGLDIIKAYGLGASFIFAGRAFMYGVAAKGLIGANHAAYIFKSDLETNMHQLGAKTLKELRSIEIV